MRNKTRNGFLIEAAKWHLLEVQFMTSVEVGASLDFLCV